MVQYSGLRRFPDAARDRAIDRLLDLRAGIANKISARNKQDTFHLASWNIRDLGSDKFNPSPRLPESLLYIAEVISAFDLVAVQEVNENMKDFQAVMRLLGPHWDYIVTDQSGNSERLAFVFDTRKILFRHIAGEIVSRLPVRLVQIQHLHRAHLLRIGQRHDAAQAGNRRYRGIFLPAARKRTARPIFCSVTSTS